MEVSIWCSLLNSIDWMWSKNTLFSGPGQGSEHADSEQETLGLQLCPLPVASGGASAAPSRGRASDPHPHSWLPRLQRFTLALSTHFLRRVPVVPDVRRGPQHPLRLLRSSSGSHQRGHQGCSKPQIKIPHPDSRLAEGDQETRVVGMARPPVAPGYGWVRMVPVDVNSKTTGATPQGLIGKLRPRWTEHFPMWVPLPTPIPLAGLNSLPSLKGMEPSYCPKKKKKQQNKTAEGP